MLAAPITDPDEIRRRLIEQVTGTVRWRESVAYMASHGVTRFFEIGAGKVLSGLVKRIADGAVGISVGGPNDIARRKTRLPPRSSSCFDAFSSREPVPTSLENALVRRY